MNSPEFSKVVKTGIKIVVSTALLGAWVESTFHPVQASGMESNNPQAPLATPPEPDGYPYTCPDLMRQPGPDGNPPAGPGVRADGSNQYWGEPRNGPKNPAAEIASNIIYCIELPSGFVLY